jgi:SAM-dependent MidA family methyltransferase
MAFERFMELALYAPGLGYYVAGARKLGRHGDFVTAPEISTLFSRCVARQVEQVLACLGRGSILEFGAGTGQMAVSILTELEDRGRLPDEYWILEVSPDLKQRQKETLERTLAHIVERVRWLECIPVAPFEGVVLANEVLDAMPVRRFRMTADGPRPLHVRQHQDTLKWCLGGGDEGLSRTLAGLQDSLGRVLPEGYESELNPHIAPWVRSVADCLTAGLLLIVDYGYTRDEFYHLQRQAGTLVCHYRHRAHFDPLWYPGLQDITASVDFSAVAEAALDAGLKVAGFANQAWFLLSAGLHELLASEDQTDTAGFLELARQAKILTLPGEMGERFKAMALTRELGADLVGFAQQDWRQRL